MNYNIVHPDLQLEVCRILSFRVLPTYLCNEPLISPLLCSTILLLVQSCGGYNLKDTTETTCQDSAQVLKISTRAYLVGKWLGGFLIMLLAQHLWMTDASLPSMTHCPEDSFSSSWVPRFQLSLPTPLPVLHFSCSPRPLFQPTAPI